MNDFKTGDLVLFERDFSLFGDAGTGGSLRGIAWQVKPGETALVIGTVRVSKDSRVIAVIHLGRVGFFWSNKKQPPVKIA